MHLARKSIDTDALVHNYCYLKDYCRKSRVLAVVKSEAYGHGLIKVARAISSHASADGFAVAVIDEGLMLREAGVTETILVMQGIADKEELQTAKAYNLALVVHSPEQLTCLEKHGANNLMLWINFDTGMNHLGFPAQSADKIIPRVKQLNTKQEPILMSHFAYANNPEMAKEDEEQWRLFERICAKQKIRSSIANSAGALCRPSSQLDWVRVGISLYGILPATVAAEHHNHLKPTMKVTAPLIAIQHCKAGDRIGYDGTYTCQREMKIGIVGIGYGDGYPRHAPNGTPIWLKGERRELVGRVSMDMLAVILDDEKPASVGDIAELWGPDLSVAEVAKHCGTVSYELLCSARGVRA